MPLHCLLYRAPVLALRILPEPWENWTDFAMLPAALLYMPEGLWLVLWEFSTQHGVWDSIHEVEIFHDATSEGGVSAAWLLKAVIPVNTVNACSWCVDYAGWSGKYILSRSARAPLDEFINPRAMPFQWKILGRRLIISWTMAHMYDLVSKRDGHAILSLTIKWPHESMNIGYNI